MASCGPCGCDFDHEEKNMEEESHHCCGNGHCHDEVETNHCGCGHSHNHSHQLSQEDLEKLKTAIAEAGYQFEETPEGEIRIIEK